MSLSSVEYVYPSQTPRHDKACAACEAPQGALFSGEALSFKDALDAVNPLQQLPLVGSLYRQATGDTLSTFSRLAGGALLGGPLGFLVAAVSAGFEAATGDDLAGHALAALDGAGEASPALVNSAYTRAQKLG